ncbi:MAG: DUF2341 domain-containing protein, partial [Bacteroidetes bacterium]
MKKNIYPLFAALTLGLLFCLPSSTQAAFTYGKYITIYESQIPGAAALTDFPVLVSVVDPDLRSVANGGYVENANGYDIQFRLSDGTTVLSHQVERYDAATGTLVAWVKVPSLSATANTFLLMYYGDATIVANPSTNATWDLSYMNVWHFNNSIANASAGAATLTDVNTTHLAAGKIAGARDLDNNTNVLSSVATGKHLRLSNGAFVGVNNFTFEGWVYLDRATTNWERIFDFGQGVNVNFFLTPSSGNAAQGTTNARITTNTNVNEQGPIVANALNTGAWIHWAVVLDDAANTMQIYKNGALFGAAAAGVTLTPANIEASTNNFFGRSQYGGDNYIDAKFDEFRLSSTNRSGNWITASYNNQNSPSTFMLISGQYSASALTGIAPAGIQGQWSANAAWPIAAVHMANLPNGKVMVWDDTQDDGAGNFNTVGPYHLSIWDPATNTHSTGPIRERNPANNQLFCAAHAQLPNGNVLAVTGEINVSDPLTMMYDWRTDKWSKLANLNYGRYYPSATALSDGGILVTGGWTSYKPANERPAAWYPEIFKNGKWTALSTGQLPFGATPQEFIDNR